MKRKGFTEEQTRMQKLNILRNAVLACAATISLYGCLTDSIQPWLESDSIIMPELDFEGDWELISDDAGDKYAVTLKKDRDSRSVDKQSYYIKISPRNYDSRFNFKGVVHKVNGIKLLQITNFSHYHDDVFSLANRPTVSLWQIAYDEDNIVIWAPGFLTENVTTLQTMRDSNDKLLFIDTTENLQAFINGWTRNYSETKDGVENILPIILTRAGTEFRMPKAMQDLVPAVYEEYINSNRD